jgi:hypothetical protein
VLTVKDKMTLDLEATWWKYAGAKEATIRELFSESPTRFYQRLNRLIDQAEALEYAPLVVRRLQRLRDQREHQRSARRLGFTSR